MKREVLFCTLGAELARLSSKGQKTPYLAPSFCCLGVHSAYETESWLGWTTLIVSVYVSLIMISVPGLVACYSIVICFCYLLPSTPPKATSNYCTIAPACTNPSNKPKVEVYIHTKIYEIPVLSWFRISTQNFVSITYPLPRAKIHINHTCQCVMVLPNP